MLAQSTTGILQNCLDRIRGGDLAAREQLIVHCQKRLRLLVRKMMRRYPNVRVWEHTSDVMQNVLIKLDVALRKIPLDTVRDFLQLAAFHTRYVLIDLARHYKHKQPVGFNSSLPVAVNSDPVNWMQWVSLHEHLDKLPEDEKILFDLLYYEGVTQEGAADLLGVSPKTLKRRWKAARLSLNRWLGDDFDF